MRKIQLIALNLLLFITFNLFSMQKFNKFIPQLKSNIAKNLILRNSSSLNYRLINEKDVNKIREIIKIRESNINLLEEQIIECKNENRCFEESIENNCCISIKERELEELKINKMRLNGLMQNKEPKIGVAIIVLKENKILLKKIKNSKGREEWSTPGKNLEFGEKIEECVKSELVEETGLEVNTIILGPWTNDFFVEEEKHYVTIYVFVNQFKGKLKTLESEKYERWEWIDLDNLQNDRLNIKWVKKIGIENLRKFLQK